MQERKQEVCDKILRTHTHRHVLTQTWLREKAGGVPFKMLTQMYKQVTLPHTNNKARHENLLNR